MKCYDCPRKCGAERSEKPGYCGQGEKLRVAKIIENFMLEEPCISGNKGTLAVFFSGCNLRCKFCQNYEISHQSKGKEYTPEEFAETIASYDLSKFSALELITPTHFSSALIKALQIIKSPIPVVWNSGGYDNEDMIEKLGEVIDVFMPDLKYFSSKLSSDLSGAADYFEVAKRAIIAMQKVVGENVIRDGVLIKGLLIRHLLLPGQVEDSMKLLDFIKDNINHPLISLMSQYTPFAHGGPDRKVYPLEYKLLLNHAEKLGLTEGYFQDLASADCCYTPEF